eukprot:gnl/Spiro4/22_TR12_c0_g1_i1.p1 gnl/Spiro4/22_TR12_c0_g1~~gnl/Spiro4/22_TR12_c0_g1_i1.p1  ORF type:complete len:586 (+),score=72.05 gnl/Spiro4/22_TR12_c0_g1_i1:93-1850(+)
MRSGFPIHLFIYLCVACIGASSSLPVPCAPHLAVDTQVGPNNRFVIRQLLRAEACPQPQPPFHSRDAVSLLQLSASRRSSFVTALINRFKKKPSLDEPTPVSSKKTTVVKSSHGRESSLSSNAELELAENVRKIARSDSSLSFKLLESDPRLLSRSGSSLIHKSSAVSASKPHKHWSSRVPHDELLKIGQGAHGRVYLAEDTASGEYVVLKEFVSKSESPQAKKEIFIMSQLLGKEGVAQCIADDATEDRKCVSWTRKSPKGIFTYIAMEAYDGDLADPSLTPTSVQQALLLASDIITGLRSLRAVSVGLVACTAPLCGWIHGDIKPSNIFVSQSLTKNRLVAVVGDFGLATFIALGLNYVVLDEGLESDDVALLSRDPHRAELPPETDLSVERGLAPLPNSRWSLPDDTTALTYCTDGFRPPELTCVKTTDLPGVEECREWLSDNLSVSLPPVTPTPRYPWWSLDVYSFGCLLFEILTNSSFFPELSDARQINGGLKRALDLYTQIKKATPPSIYPPFREYLEYVKTRLSASSGPFPIPDSLATVIAGATQWRPSDRWSYDRLRFALDTELVLLSVGKSKFLTS